MDPDLVGPPGARYQLHQREAPPGAQYPVVSAGRLALGVHLPPDGGAGGPSNGQGDIALERLWISQAQGQVPPLEGSAVELPPQLVVDVSALGNNHHPGGAPVQPVHRMEGEALTQIVGQAVGQGWLSGG